MIVRIRLQYGPRVSRKARKNRHLALALATLLTPAALTFLALGMWRLAADIQLAGQFAITEGFFSHWQVWLILATVVQLAAMILNRYGNDQPLLRNVEEKPVKT